MKILLVYPPTLSPRDYGLPRTPPLGICYLAAVLIKMGHEVKLIDMRLKDHNYPRLESLLKKFKPHLVGVSATSLDYPGAKTVFELVKKFSPKTITILGGAHASLAGKDAIKSPNIDIVLKGEGERALPKIINCLKNNRSLSVCEGVVYKTKNGRIIDKSERRKPIFDLDKLPFPQFDLLPLEKYKATGSLCLPIITSRGCPFNCIFCASWQIHGRIYRKRSAINVVDEIEHNIQKYGVRHFSVLDDNFNFDKKRVIDICREIIKRKLDISWECTQGIRADRADEELFSWMKKGGCNLVALGVESADPKVLKAIRKGETISTIKKAIKAAKKAGLIIKGFFLVGAPGDNEQSVKKSVKFFQTSDIDIPRISNMTVYPYTDLWEWVKKHGRFISDPIDFITKKAEQSEVAQFETDDFSASKRIKMFNWATAEAEKRSIKYKLNSMFGKEVANLLLPILQLSFSRKLIKKMYQLKLIKVVD